MIETPPSKTPPGLRARLRAMRTPPHSIVPRGNLTFAGIVLRLSPEFMVLRTRSDGQKTILIRHDTGFVERGCRVDASELAVTTRVFIRAGRNFEGDLEAYQVVWGEILPAR